MTTMTGPTTDTVVRFDADDGRPLTLVHVVGDRPATRDPVIVIHGAGVRADLFRPPVQETFVRALVDEGYDVWLLNWRASIDFAPNQWTLDQAAKFDHPAAVRTVCELTGSPTVRAVVHCQGSTSFMMAVTAGLLPQVTNVVSNAVSLHPVVPWWSRAKIERIAPVVRRFLPYLDPAWGNQAPSFLTGAMVAGVRLVHRECNNSVCKMVSFTYGSGTPALWRHENLNPETHDWIKGQFGAVPLSFFRQMGRCVRAGHLVSVQPELGLPASFVAEAPKTSARFTFLAGDRNRCFLPESQERTFRFFDSHEPGRHAFHLFEGYGHLDVFFGDRAATDTFPTILKELAQS